MRRVLLAAAFALSLNAFAQLRTGAIHGQIRLMDPSMPMIIGANVRIIQGDGEDFKTLQTEDDGSFVVENVPEGRYTVAVSTNGESQTDVCTVVSGEICRVTFEF